MELLEIIFDQNFEQLVQLLTAQTGYASNENDLKVTTLATLLAGLKTKNTEAITTLAPLSNTRLSRNNTLYAAETGLVDIAPEVLYKMSIQKPNPIPHSSQP